MRGESSSAPSRPPGCRTGPGATALRRASGSISAARSAAKRLRQQPARAGRRRTPGRRGTRCGRRTRSARPRGTSGSCLRRRQRAAAAAPLEDVERLADGRAARGRRAHAEDVEAAVVARASACARARRSARMSRVVIRPGPPGRGRRRRSAAGCCAARAIASAIGAAVEAVSRRAGRSARTSWPCPGCAAPCRRRARCRRDRGRAPRWTGCRRSRRRCPAPARRTSRSITKPSRATSIAGRERAPRATRCRTCAARRPSPRRCPARRPRGRCSGRR